MSNAQPKRHFYRPIEHPAPTNRKHDAQQGNLVSCRESDHETSQIARLLPPTGINASVKIIATTARPSSQRLVETLPQQVFSNAHPACRPPFRTPEWRTISDLPDTLSWRIEPVPCPLRCETAAVAQPHLGLAFQAPDLAFASCGENPAENLPGFVDPFQQDR